MLLSTYHFVFIILLSLYGSTQARPPRRKLGAPPRPAPSPISQTGEIVSSTGETEVEPVTQAATDTESVSSTDPKVIGNLPMMGWNPYNVYGCSMDEARATSNLNDFANSGLIGLGYNHFSIECGWIDKKRDAKTEAITDNRVLWPNGIHAFGQLVKSKKMRFGLTTSLGVYACGSSKDDLYPGSYFHEDVDAKALADFGADYVKINSCFYHADQPDATTPRDDFDMRFQAISNSMVWNHIDEVATNQLGTPFIDRLTKDVESPDLWSSSYGVQYRVGDNIAAGNNAPTGWNEILRIMNQAIHIAERDGASGPGQYADLDLLAVGNDGLTYDEQCTHYAFWALFKSPLMISMDLSKLQEEKYQWILNRKELIAANQDIGGKPIKLVQRLTDNFDLFAGPLSNDAVAVLIVDHSNTKQEVKIVLATLGIEYADIINMWTEELNPSNRITGTYTGWIEAHGSIALKLINIKRLVRNPSYTWYEAEKASLINGAQIKPCSGCSNKSKVGEMTGDASIKFNNVAATSDIQYINIQYINAEVQYAGAGTPNIRGAYFIVNGGDQQLVKFPISAYSWQTPATFFQVTLSGFHADKDNTIEIKVASYVSGWAPDFDRIGIASITVGA